MLDSGFLLGLGMGCGRGHILSLGVMRIRFFVFLSVWAFFMVISFSTITRIIIPLVIIRLSWCIPMSVRRNTSDRFTSFLTLTYVEDRERVEHLASLLKAGNLQVAWAVHDKDLKEDGSFDKPHCHCVVHVRSAMTLSAFARRYALNPAHVQIAGRGEDTADDESVKDCKGLFVYLIHGDRKSKTLGKYQYPLSVIKGPWATYVRDWLRNKPKYKQDEEKDSFLQILDWIDNQGIISTSEFCRWSVSHGHYAAFRRNQSVLRQVVKEHNDDVRFAYQQKDYESWLELETERQAIRKQENEHLRRTSALRYAKSLIDQAGGDSSAYDSLIKVEQTQLKKVVDMDLIRALIRGDFNERQESNKFAN